MKIIIRGNKINLRTFHKSDIFSLIANANNKAINRHSAVPYPYTPQYADDFIRKARRETRKGSAFHAFKLHKISADVVKSNLASIKLLKKFDFKEEGYLQEHIYINKQWLNIVFYGLLNKNYDLVRT